MTKNLIAKSLPSADRGEFVTSLIVAVLGFVFVSIFLPPVGHEACSRDLSYIPLNASRNAGYFVVALTAFLLGFNAYRDPQSTLHQRIGMICWMGALCAGMTLSLLVALHWLKMLQPETYPVWLQIVLAKV